MTLVLTWLFALLTVLSWLSLGAAAASGRSRDLARRPGVAVGIAASVTGTATVGSLYLSEVAGFIPCELCWVQRIFMYSLAVVTSVAVLRRRDDVFAYATPLAVLGLFTSAWHIVVQRLPAAGETCDPTAPCSAIWIQRLGFITIPVMAGTAFAVVVGLALIARGQHGRAARPTGDTARVSSSDHSPPGTEETRP